MFQRLSHIKPMTRITPKLKRGAERGKRKVRRTMSTGRESRTGWWGQTRQARRPLERRRTCEESWSRLWASARRWSTCLFRCMASGTQLSPPYVPISSSSSSSLYLCCRDGANSTIAALCAPQRKPRLRETRPSERCEEGKYLDSPELPHNRNWSIEIPFPRI